ncbi:hypothetical protein [Kitasatospora sp. NPDC057015]|uniref:hypothetical protein n=1 Tax=Kitasatospora sp. NPDC057015 TaxID=3346001 RepID=UPI0036447B19
MRATSGASAAFDGCVSRSTSRLLRDLAVGRPAGGCGGRGPRVRVRVTGLTASLPITTS